MSAPTSSDRTMECMVCGKLFPRGPLDLARHTTAITLQHLYQEKKSSLYNVGPCNKCGLFFTAEDHFKMHKKDTSCKRGGRPKPLEPPEEEVDHVNMGRKENVTGGGDGDETPRTLECMVCGKLFPRGPVDLARHATAVTLKHLVHTAKNATFPHGCCDCGAWFTTEEHLQSHKELSTCNPDMVWPHDASEKSGLKCIHKDSTNLTSTSTTGLHSHSSAASGRSSSATHAGGMQIVYPSGGSKYVKKRDRVENSIVATKATDVNSHLLLVDTGRSEGAAHKRARVLIPEDRKVLYAVISLLLMTPEDGSIAHSASVSNSTNNPVVAEETVVPNYNDGTPVTDDNYLSLLSPKSRVLIQKLQSVLFHNC